MKIQLIRHAQLSEFFKIISVSGSYIVLCQKNIIKNISYRLYIWGENVLILS